MLKDAKFQNNYYMMHSCQVTNYNDVVWTFSKEITFWT